MDFGIIIAISIGSFSIVGVMVTMLLWLRSEARSDWRNLQDQVISDRRDFIGICRNIESSINEMKIENSNFRTEMHHLVTGIQLENKDFHFRLLEIERSRK